MTLTEKLTIRQLYNKHKDYLWSNSPFYPNNLKLFEKWFNKYLIMLEKYEPKSNKEFLITDSEYYNKINGLK